MRVTVEAWDQDKGYVVLKTRGGVAHRKLQQAIAEGWVVDLDVSQDLEPGQHD